MVDGLSTYQSVVVTADLLRKIITTCRDAKRLKSECAEIVQYADVVKKVLDENPQSLKDHKSNENLHATAMELYRFAIWCREASFVQRAWEIVWKHKLPGLLQKLFNWILIVNMETTSSIKTNMTLADEAQKRKVQHDDSNAFAACLKSQSTILEDLKKSLKADDKPPELPVDFKDNDKRLFISEKRADFMAGSLSVDGILQTEKVICEPVNEDLMRYGEKGPRHVVIYAKISANTGVHPFYGIAERSGKRWTVMKDLRGTPTIADAIKNRILPDSITDRLNVVYEIAKTVEYLHSVEVLIKHLSDRTVLLESGSETLVPYLINLERARLIKERTMGGEYDMRFEAPEMLEMKQRQHSIYSDIWSLGILIWQCMTGTFPFGFRDEVFEGPDVTSIQNSILKRDVFQPAHGKSERILENVLHIANQCCNLRPTIRPSATQVVHSLLDTIITAAIGAEIDQEPVDETVKERVAEALETKGPSKGIIVEQDAKNLRLLVDRGDSTAAYLYGLAIWTDTLAPEENEQQMILISKTDRDKELRARLAMVHLEFAIEAGVKAAAKPLCEIHRTFLELYAGQHNQSKTMKVI